VLFETLKLPPPPAATSGKGGPAARPEAAGWRRVPPALRRPAAPATQRAWLLITCHFRRRRAALAAGSSLSTKAEVLEELVGLHPVAGIVLEHRKLTKLLHGFLDALVAHARASLPGSQASSQRLLRRLRGDFLQVRAKGLGLRPSCWAVCLPGRLAWLRAPFPPQLPLSSAPPCAPNCPAAAEVQRAAPPALPQPSPRLARPPADRHRHRAPGHGRAQPADRAQARHLLRGPQPDGRGGGGGGAVHHLQHPRGLCGAARLGHAGRRLLPAGAAPDGPL
jgi:hypothetical protein